MKQKARFMPIRFAVAVLLAACLFGQAEAQTGRRGPPDGGRGDAKRRDDAASASANDQVRHQLANVRSALKLTQEQAPAWEAYEKRIVGLLDDLSRGFNQPPGASAVKQIDARVDMVRNRLTAMEEIADAAARLYAGLSDEQKGTADRLLPGTLPALYSGAPMRAAVPRGAQK